MKEIPVSQLMLNPMEKISKEWMLVTAGTMEQGFNTMTVSWGHLGFLWGKPTAVIYIRPQRYTNPFLKREDVFTISFLPQEYKGDMRYLGTHSGRDGDKLAATSLTPVAIDGSVGFRESEVTLVCRKLYCAPMVEEGFVDRSILDQHYPNMDLHDVFVAEILTAYGK